MFWALLAGIGVCTNAAYFIANKIFLQRLSPCQLAAAGFLSTALILTPFVLATGIPVIGPAFFLAALATTVLNILGTAITFRSLSSSDISLAIPMLSFTPLFLVGTASLLLGESPSAAGAAGIVIIVTGSYILNTAAEHESIADPFRAMVSHPGVLGMLGVAFLYSISINFDKIVVQNSDPLFASASVTLMLGVSFAVLAILEHAGLLPGLMHPVQEHSGSIGPCRSPASWFYLIGAGLVGGTLVAVEAVAINSAYLIQIAPYVIAIKRMSIILVVLYGTLIFHERELVRRITGAGLMVTGAVLILVFP